MSNQDLQRQPAVLAVDDVLANAETISDEEAEAEIEIPETLGNTSQPTAADTTPSVRIAIDKAADMLRQLRGEH